MSQNLAGAGGGALRPLSSSLLQKLLSSLRREASPVESRRLCGTSCHEVQPRAYSGVLGPSGSGTHSGRLCLAGHGLSMGWPALVLAWTGSPRAALEANQRSLFSLLSLATT